MFWLFSFHFRYWISEVREAHFLFHRKVFQPNVCVCVCVCAHPRVCVASNTHLLLSLLRFFFLFTDWFHPRVLWNKNKYEMWSRWKNNSRIEVGEWALNEKSRRKRNKNHSRSSLNSGKMRTEKKNKDNNADSFFVILMCNAYGIQVERTVETQRERKRIISKSTTNTSNRTLYI